MSQLLARTISTITGDPILVAVSGHTGMMSRNRKTGPIPQIWILPADIEPNRAVKTGHDRAVCGDCPRRWSVARANGLEPCYVVPYKAPLTIWRQVQGQSLQPVGKLADICPPSRHPTIRVGAYGDPVAVAPDVWAWLLDGYRGRVLSYTRHYWRDDLRQWSMASVDNQRQAQAVAATGWRYFRVSDGTPTVGAGERVCPASTGPTTCAVCRQCRGAAGTSARSIVIQSH
jgi:hypothetical protein